MAPFTRPRGQTSAISARGAAKEDSLRTAPGTAKVHTCGRMFLAKLTILNSVHERSFTKELIRNSRRVDRHARGSRGDANVETRCRSCSYKRHARKRNLAMAAFSLAASFGSRRAFLNPSRARRSDVSATGKPTNHERRRASAGESFCAVPAAAIFLNYSIGFIALPCSLNGAGRSDCMLCIYTYIIYVCIYMHILRYYTSLFAVARTYMRNVDMYIMQISIRMIRNAISMSISEAQRYITERACIFTTNLSLSCIHLFINNHE